MAKFTKWFKLFQSWSWARKWCARS